MICERLARCANEKVGVWFLPRGASYVDRTQCV